MNSNLINKAAIAQNQLHQLFRLVLKSGVKIIRKCGFTRNNQVPWVSYINAWGQSCSGFIKKSLFVGYDIEINSNWATVTDLATGNQYSVKLDSFYCSCEAFKKSNFLLRCEHINQVAKLYPELETAIATEDLDIYIEQPAESAELKIAESGGVNTSGVPPLDPRLFKIGDRVMVNCFDKKIMAVLGTVAHVNKVGGDISAVVEMEGYPSTLFWGEHLTFASGKLSKFGEESISPKPSAP